MNRLTARNEYGRGYYPRCFEAPCRGRGCKYSNCGFTSEICDTLAAYEDTGLEPDEINKAVSIQNWEKSYSEQVERDLEELKQFRLAAAQANAAPEDVCELCQFKLHCGCMDDDHDYKMEECQYYAAAHDLAELRRRGGMRGWISVEDRLPPEHDSFFSRFYGTNKWQSAMFRRVSDRVNITVLFHDGTKGVYTSKTHDGIWDITEPRVVDGKARVTHWQPLPAPPAST